MTEQSFDLYRVTINQGGCESTWRERLRRARLCLRRPEPVSVLYMPTSSEPRKVRAPLSADDAGISDEFHLVQTGPSVITVLAGGRIEVGDTGHLTLGPGSVLRPLDGGGLVIEMPAAPSFEDLGVMSPMGD